MKEIPRPLLRTAFHHYAHNTNGIVIGSPGVGKSFLLRQFTESIGNESEIPLFIPIDKLGIENEDDLNKAVGNKSTFSTFLADNRRPDGVKRILIIDALDAARSEVARRFFLNLIRTVIADFGESWNVIVSVRTYDAVRSKELQELFPVTHSNSPSSEFLLRDVRCQHFNVPPLSDDERLGAIDSIKGLPAVFEKASTDLRELFRIPFNLWLADKILSTGAASDNLSAVSSAVQLLDLFWEFRISNDALADERRVLLTGIAKQMVQTLSLSVRVEEVYDASLRDAWNSLLASEVISHTANEQRIGFHHNILFDYAVGRLLIEDSPGEVVSFLAKHQSRPLFLRPSLDFYFTRLWYLHRETFWKIFWEILPSEQLQVRMFGRLLPPTVLVNEAKDLGDVEPLITALKTEQENSTDAVRRILQAYRMLRPAFSGVWIYLLVKLTEHLHHEFAADVAIITGDFLEEANRIGLEEGRNISGQIARQLLSWILESRATGDKAWHDNLGAGWVIPMVAKTHGTNLVASRELIRSVLKKKGDPDFSANYFYRLAEHVSSLWTNDPEFAREVYRSILSHGETSDAKTQFGTPVVPMTSTRRQDFQMAKYLLANSFSKFLEAHPLEAVRTAIETINEYTVRENDSMFIRPKRRKPETFEFRGKKVRYSGDSSYFWDISVGHDDLLGIAARMFNFIEEIIKREDQDTFHKILDEIATVADGAYVWRRLLEIGSRYPTFTIPDLLELTTAAPVMTGVDTWSGVESFIESAAEFMTKDQRAHLETSIIKNAKRFKDSDEAASWQRRLIARISPELLIKEESKQIRNSIESSGVVPPKTTVPKIQITSRPYTEELWFEEQGIDLSKSENKTLVDSVKPIKEFVSTWRNEIPTIEAVSAVVEQAVMALEIADGSSEADDSVKESVWTDLTECARKMVQAPLDADSPTVEFCRKVILRASKHSSPLPNPEYDDDYTTPSWSPAPRIEAAQALPWLFLRSYPDAEVAEAITRLINDKKPVVRFLIVSELFRIVDKSPKIYWRLIRGVAIKEENKVVLGAMIRTLSFTANKYEFETTKILRSFLNQWKSRLDDVKIWGDLVPLVVGLAIVRENKWAISTLQQFLRKPDQLSEPLGIATYESLLFVSPEAVRKSGNKDNSSRAIFWLCQFFDAVTAGTNRLLVERSSNKISDESFQSKLRSMYHVIDDSVLRLFFMAKIESLHRIHSQEEAITDDERREYYFRVKPLLEKVVTFASDSNAGFLFAPTAYHFMQLLEGVLDYEPVDVIHMASLVARSSASSGYTFDSMAVTQVVNIVERILADYRYEVRADEPLADLLILLDLFADTGNAAALRLVWRLDEIYR